MYLIKYVLVQGKLICSIVTTSVTGNLYMWYMADWGGEKQQRDRAGNRKQRIRSGREHGVRTRMLSSISGKEKGLEVALGEAMGLICGMPPLF